MEHLFTPPAEGLPNVGPPWMQPLDLVEGTIYLRGENIYIRVHRTVLELHSPIFQKILGENPALAADSRKPPTLQLPFSDTDLIHYTNALYNRDRCAERAGSYVREIY